MANPQGNCFEGLLIENRKYISMKGCLRTLLIILPLFAILFSCANDMEVVNKFIDEETEPDLIGVRVEVLRSDSARLQMKLVAPRFIQFASASEQRDEFPEGLHVWYYEKSGELRAEITANWAIHDVATDLWEARSNVVITDKDGKKLETEQLFWDPKKGEVYSNKFTKITSEDGTIATGDTFTANQDFLKWKLSKGRATIMIKDEDKNED